MKYKLYCHAQLQPDAITDFVLVIDASCAAVAKEKAGMLLLRGKADYITVLPVEQYEAFSRDKNKPHTAETGGLIPPE